MTAWDDQVTFVGSNDTDEEDGEDGGEAPRISGWMPPTEEVKEATVRDAQTMRRLDFDDTITGPNASKPAPAPAASALVEDPDAMFSAGDATLAALLLALVCFVCPFVVGVTALPYPEPKPLSAAPADFSEARARLLMEQLTAGVGVASAYGGGGGGGGGATTEPFLGGNIAGDRRRRERSDAVHAWLVGACGGPSRPHVEIVRTHCPAAPAAPANGTATAGGAAARTCDAGLHPGNATRFRNPDWDYDPREAFFAANGGAPEPAVYNVAVRISGARNWDTARAQRRAPPPCASAGSALYPGQHAAEATARAAGDALLVSAHLDTTPGGPGARNAAAVGAVAELCRNLAASETKLERDVILLLSDRAAYDLGGSAFFQRFGRGGKPAPCGAQHWQLQVKHAVNLHSVGAGGHAWLYRANSFWLVREYAQAVPRPVGSSIGEALLSALSAPPPTAEALRERSEAGEGPPPRRAGNFSTDAGTWAGWAGALDLGAVHDRYLHATALDADETKNTNTGEVTVNPPNGSIQDLGENLLALVRHMADELPEADLLEGGPRFRASARPADPVYSGAVYFSMFNRWMMVMTTYGAITLYGTTAVLFLALTGAASFAMRRTDAVTQSQYYPPTPETGRVAIRRPIFSFASGRTVLAFALVVGAAVASVLACTAVGAAVVAWKTSSHQRGAVPQAVLDEVPCGFKTAFRGLAVPLAFMLAFLTFGVMCFFVALLDNILRGTDGKGGMLRCGSCLLSKRLRFRDKIGQDLVELHTYYAVMYVQCLLLGVLAVCAGDSTIKFGISAAHVPFVTLWSMFLARVLEGALAALWGHWCGDYGRSHDGTTVAGLTDMGTLGGYATVSDLGSLRFCSGLGSGLWALRYLVACSFTGCVGIEFIYNLGMVLLSWESTFSLYASLPILGFAFFIVVSPLLPLLQRMAGGAHPRRGLWWATGICLLGGVVPVKILQNTVVD